MSHQPTGSAPVVFLAGAPGVGKTSIGRMVAKALPNSILLERDIISLGASHIRPTEDVELGSISTYLGSEVTQQNPMLKTPFGDLVSLEGNSGYFQRHVRVQSYWIVLQLALTNVHLGKIAIVDALFPYQFENGVVDRVLEYLAGYNTILVFIHLPEDVLRRRLEDRCQLDPSYELRDSRKLATEHAWQEEITRNPVLPQGLNRHPHCLVSSVNSIEDCAAQVVSYIQSRMQSHSTD